jgi:hypothetical protein
MVCSKITKLSFDLGGEQINNGHAHCNAVLDLIQDDTLGRIGNV